MAACQDAIKSDNVIIGLFTKAQKLITEAPVPLLIKSRDGSIKTFTHKETTEKLNAVIEEIDNRKLDIMRSFGINSHFYGEKISEK